MKRTKTIGYWVRGDLEGSSFNRPATGVLFRNKKDAVKYVKELKRETFLPVIRVFKVEQIYMEDRLVPSVEGRNWSKM